MKEQVVAFVKNNFFYPYEIGVEELLRRKNKKIREWLLNVESLPQKDKLLKALLRGFEELKELWEDPELLREKYDFLKVGHPDLEEELEKGVRISFRTPYFPDYTPYDLCRRENYVNYLIIKEGNVSWTGDIPHFNFRYPVPPENEEWDWDYRESFDSLNPTDIVVGFRETCSFSELTPLWVGLTLLPKPLTAKEWLGDWLEG